MPNTSSALIDKFLDSLRMQQRFSVHTLSAYATDLSQFQAFLLTDGDVQALEASPMHIRAWLIALNQQEKLEAKSIARKMACLRSFYRYLLKWGFIQENPMAALRQPKLAKRTPSFLEEQEIPSFSDYAMAENDFPSFRDAFIVELLYGTGMRISELISLKLGDIDFHRRELRVLGKGNKMRIIPFGEALLAAINRYLQAREQFMLAFEQHSFLIVSNKGAKAYAMLIERAVASVMGAYNTRERVHPHQLRHSFATHLLNNGAEILAIKELLGHSSLNATQVYTHNNFEKLKEAYAKAHPRAKK